MANTPPDPWEKSVGLTPHIVTVFERVDKGMTLYLRWRKQTPTGPNWGKRSLGITARDDRGRLKREVLELAEREAYDQYEVLSGRRAPRPGTGTVHRPLALGETWAILTDPKTGKFPVDSLHRRDVSRALQAAIRILGPEKAWAHLDRSQWRTLGRTLVDEYRSRGKVGARSAELTLQILLAVAVWLREEERIPVDAAHPAAKWNQELRDYVAQLQRATPDRRVTPDQLSYTLDEARKLFAVSWDVDPRLGLALSVGAELRLGQVVRVWRRHLDRDRGRIVVEGRGKKRGAVLRLTVGQCAAVERALTGYLRELEAMGKDYPLFPAGTLRGARVGKPMAVVSRHATKSATKAALEHWHELAEAKAEIPHIPGRGWYGVKRTAVNEAKKAKISREGLKALGGWTDTQMPDRIYAEQTMEYALEEAMHIRARLRGEEEPSDG